MLFLLSIPILALVDADPYGMDILCVYKYGSLSLEHEGQQLAAGRLHWIGVRLSELDMQVLQFVVGTFEC